MLWVTIVTLNSFIHSFNSFLNKEGEREREGEGEREGGREREGERIVRELFYYSGHASVNNNNKE